MEIDKNLLLVFLVYMTINDKWEEEINRLKEKHEEIKEKRRNEEIGRILESNPYF